MTIRLFDNTNLPTQKESNENHPVLWFDDFIKTNQPYRFKQDFFQSAKENHSEGLVIDYEGVAFSYTDFVANDGYELRTNISYSNFLEGIVRIQKEKSKELIFNKIASCTSLGASKLFLGTTIDRIQYLINMLKRHNNTSLRDFPDIPMSLYDILNYIEEAHGSYLPNPLPAIFSEAENPQIQQFSNLIISHDGDLFPTNSIYKEAESAVCDQQSSQSELPDNNTKPDKLEVEMLQSFAWLGDDQSEILYTILKEKGAIKEDETNLDIFKSAFNGKPLEKPLEIRWHLCNSYKSLKAPIIRTIYYLSNELLLLKPTETKSELARRIKNIFVDPRGNRFAAVEITIQNMSKKLSWPEKILLEGLQSMRKK
ncbi:hypothetical protein HXX01_00590 [Candidatus Nomurabacteria bacterium]|nr:hypothetical protein [Candidatus Nomurabacteria bacterium]